MEKNLLDNYNYGGDGRHLACAGGLCAFLQGTNDKEWSGWDLKWMLRALKTHGCETCGSIPVGEVNDVGAAGMLTANYVWAENDQSKHKCDDHWQTVELLEGPDSKRWVDAVLWKMNRDQVWTNSSWANNVPISCVGAVDSTLVVRGSICAIARNAAGGGMSGEKARNIAMQIQGETSCGFGAQFAADDAPVLSVRGYLGIELIQDSCPVGSH